MLMRIYDYKNRPKDINLPDKEIHMINVIVVTGDEIVTVRFSDGSLEKHDSSDRRITDYFDGAYDVTGDKIKDWMNYKPSGKRTYSYERIYRFG